MAGGFVKTILCIFTIITIAGGGVILYLTATRLDNYNDLWQYVNANMKTYASYGLWGLGIFTCLTGISGLIGVLQKSRCLQSMFGIFALILCILFTGASIGITIFTNNQYNDLKSQNCDTTDPSYDWLSQSNQLYSQLGDKYFCSDLCACYVQNVDDFPASTFKGKVVTPIKKSPINFQECAISKLNHQYDQYIPLVVFVENNFECSGICDPVPIYMFTDINRGPPTYTQGCKIRIQDFFEKYGNTIRLISLIIGGFFLLQILCACCICCSTKRKKGDYYRIID